MEPLVLSRSSPRWTPMFTLDPSTFKPNKLLVKLLIPNRAKAVLLVSFILSVSALGTDSMLKYGSVGMFLLKKKEHRSVLVICCPYWHHLTLSKFLLLLHQAFQWIFCTWAINCPCNKVFFTNSAGDLLPAPDFLGRLYNFCNLVLFL